MLLLLKIQRNFNPRLREGGDLFSSRLLFWRQISIHASAKEATIRQRICGIPGRISIHASAKEATSFPFFKVSAKIDFNPRLREGGDLSPYAYIQTPLNFNPRLREGGDFPLF